MSEQYTVRVTPAQLARDTGQSVKEVERMLKHLEAAGRVKPVDQGYHLKIGKGFSE